VIGRASPPALPPKAPCCLPSVPPFVGTAITPFLSPLAIPGLSLSRIHLLGYSRLTLDFSSGSSDYQPFISRSHCRWPLGLYNTDKFADWLFLSKRASYLVFSCFLSNGPVVSEAHTLFSQRLSIPVREQSPRIDTQGLCCHRLFFLFPFFPRLPLTSPRRFLILLSGVKWVTRPFPPFPLSSRSCLNAIHPPVGIDSIFPSKLALRPSPLLHGRKVVAAMHLIPFFSVAPANSSRHFPLP